jgi:hypothetical protein
MDMKKTILFIGFLMISGMVSAQPIGDVDNFQKNIERCIKGKHPDRCLNNLLPQHVPPGNDEMARQLPNVTSLFVKWLGSSSVYAIHPISEKKVGDIVDIRHYAIESNDPSFMVMRVKYIKLLGKSYLFGFNLSSTDDTISALLSGNLK